MCCSSALQHTLGLLVTHTPPLPTNVALLSGNHLIINFILCNNLLLNEGIIHFVKHLLHHLVKWVDPRSTTVIGPTWCSSQTALITSFLHRHYKWQK